MRSLLPSSRITRSPADEMVVTTRTRGRKGWLSGFRDATLLKAVVPEMQQSLQVGQDWGKQVLCRTMHDLNMSCPDDAPGGNGPPK